MNEATAVNRATGTALLDLDPVDLVHASHGVAVTDQALLNLVHAVLDLEADGGPTGRVVWSDTQEPVLARCGVCGSVGYVAEDLVPDYMEHRLVCSVCLDD